LNHGHSGFQIKAFLLASFVHVVGKTGNDQVHKLTSNMAQAQEQVIPFSSSQLQESPPLLADFLSMRRVFFGIFSQSDLPDNRELKKTTTATSLNKRLNEQNNGTLVMFGTFLCSPLQNINVKLPNSALSAEREPRRLFF